MNNIVIVGNTAGAFGCMDKLKKSGRDLSLTVISPEDHPAYKKGLLLDLFFNRVNQKDIFFCDRSYYKQNNIQFFPDARISQINTKKKRVDIKDGDKLNYDHLVFACGRNTILPDIPGAGKRGISPFDTLSDLNEINGLAALVKHAVVIGESRPASDFARELINREIDTVLFSKDGAFSHDEKLAVISDQPIVEFIGEGEVRAIKLGSGKVLAASMVVFFGRQEPDEQMFRDTDIEFFDSAVVVNEKQRTNIPDIFAVGNLTSKNGVIKTWQDAFAEGELAASAILEDIG
ncbi:MAG: FAD-dependent oxidoreductase [Candidatus Omnitrophica bacterium]|nr:FAD-dependent oxidoreductase [Candidatus Omnitrophota bacterium]